MRSQANALVWPSRIKRLSDFLGTKVELDDLLGIVNNGLELDTSSGLEFDTFGRTGCGVMLRDSQSPEVVWGVSPA